MTCDFVPLKSFQTAVVLERIRANAQLATSPIIKQTRVAVLPLNHIDYKLLIQLSL